MVRAIFSVWSQDLPDKWCEVLPFTIWKHAPFTSNQENTSLLGTHIFANRARIIIKQL